MGSLFNLPPKSIRHRRLPRANCLISMGIMGGGITGASERDRTSGLLITNEMWRRRMLRRAP